MFAGSAIPTECSLGKLSVGYIISKWVSEITLINLEPSTDLNFHCSILLIFAFKFNKFVLIVGWFIIVIIRSKVQSSLEMNWKWSNSKSRNKNDNRIAGNKRLYTICRPYIHLIRNNPSLFTFIPTSTLENNSWKAFKINGCSKSGNLKIFILLANAAVCLCYLLAIALLTIGIQGDGNNLI